MDPWSRLLKLKLTTQYLNSFIQKRLFTWRPVVRLCNWMLDEIRLVTYSVSAAVPAPQQLSSQEKDTLVLLSGSY